jgi:hypothetical protein
VKEAIILDRAEIQVHRNGCIIIIIVYLYVPKSGNKHHDYFFVQEHSCVLHSIIGWDCILGAWSRVEGYPRDPNPNDPLASVSSESLFNEEGRLNPSITILGECSNYTCR